MSSNRLSTIATVVATLVGAACADAQPADQTAAPTTDAEMSAFLIGFDIARQIQAQGIQLPDEQLLAGLRAGLAGEDLPLPAEEMQAARQRFEQAERQRLAAVQQEQATEQRAAGDAFLAENGARASVNTLAPGLQYEVLVEGSGDKPSASDRVTVHYRGTLLDSTEFDSSYARNQPVTFPLNGVISGWTQALTQMPVGSKWKLFIGPDLAYGDSPPPGSKIPPGATLIFEVELLEIAE